MLDNRNEKYQLSNDAGFVVVHNVTYELLLVLVLLLEIDEGRKPQKTACKGNLLGQNFKMFFITSCCILHWNLFIIYIIRS